MNQKTTALLACGSLFLFGSTADAQDGTQKFWAGPYVGSFTGYQRSALAYMEPARADFERSPALSGFSGGILAGYNFQLEHVVFGFEADTSPSRLSVSPEATTLNNYSAFRIDWASHLRARYGYTTGATLYYLAGGLATARIQTDDTDPRWGQDAGSSIGWTVGAGLEHDLTRHLKLRAEYLYDDYGSKDYRIPGASPYSATTETNSQILRMGLEFKF